MNLKRLFCKCALGTSVIIFIGCTETPRNKPSLSIKNEDIESLRRTVANSKNADQKIDAIDSLSKQGKKSVTALKELQIAMEDGSSLVRSHALRATGKLGNDAIPALSSITHKLAEKNDDVAIQAAVAIQTIAADTQHSQRNPESWKTANEALLEAFRRPDPRLKKVVLKALLECDLSQSQEAALQESLKNTFESDPECVLPILSILAEKPESALPLLSKFVHEPDARYWVAVLAVEMAQTAEPLLEELCKIATSTDAPTLERFQAVLAIAAIDKATEESINALKSCAAATNKHIRAVALFTIGKLRLATTLESLEVVTPPYDATISCLHDWAVARIHPSDTLATTRAIESLSDQIHASRNNSSFDEEELLYLVLPAMASLYEMASAQSREVITQSITPLLASPEVVIRTHTLSVVLENNIPTTEVIAASLEADHTRNFALKTLAHFGHDSKKTTVTLLKMLNEANPDEQQNVLMALATTGKSSAAAVTELGHLINDPTQLIQNKRSATYALGHYGPTAKSLYNLLIPYAQLTIRFS